MTEKKRNELPLVCMDDNFLENREMTFRLSVWMTVFSERKKRTSAARMKISIREKNELPVCVDDNFLENK